MLSMFPFAPHLAFWQTHYAGTEFGVFLLSSGGGKTVGTDGNIRIATDAVQAAARGHHFLSVHKNGQVAIVHTAGNKDCHVILRGGKAPNYDAASIEAASQVLAKAGLPARLMVDASHANSGKDPDNQPAVVEDIAAQLEGGERRIVGVMVESHLVGGRQDLVDGQPLALTSHEFKLLSLLMQRVGEVLSRTELSEHLYPQDSERDSNTIEVFVGRLRKKLPPGSIETVRGLGYRPVEASATP